jgi:hypothetical protein
MCRRNFPIPLFLPPFIRDPLHRYFTVMRIDLDPDRFAFALRKQQQACSRCP